MGGQEEGEGPEGGEGQGCNWQEEMMKGSAGVTSPSCCCLSLGAGEGWAKWTEPLRRSISPMSISSGSVERSILAGSFVV